VGHAHLALLGTFSFILTSSICYGLPRITGREWHSEPLIRAHYWLKFLGFMLMMTSLQIGGLIQAAGWHHAIPVDQWSIEMVPYWLLRMFSGVMIVTGQFIFAYNVFHTLFGKVKAPVAAKVQEVKA